jgi:hypothetical protein
MLLQGGSNAAKKASNKNRYSKIIVVFLKNKNQLPLLPRFLPLILPTYIKAESASTANKKEAKDEEDWGDEELDKIDEEFKKLDKEN